MLDPQPIIDELPSPTCQRCSQPIITRSVRCPHCGEIQSAVSSRRWRRDRLADIVYACLLFYVTHKFMERLLLVSDVRQSLLWWALAWLIVLGIPLSVVGYEWTRLQSSDNPDYTKLWRTYWRMQLIVFGVLLALAMTAWFIAVVWLSI